MNKKIIIIGGGLTGITAGIHARRHGYEAEIFESHSLPGGVCTSWERKGYTFDGAFHWWLGSVPESPFYKFFEQVGIFPETEVCKRELFTIIKPGDVSEFKVWADQKKLKDGMIKLAPEDTEEIEGFFKDVSEIGSMELPLDKPQEAFTLIDLFKMMKKSGPQLKQVQKYMKMSISDYASRFSSQKLKEIFFRIFPPDCPIFVMMNFLNMFNYSDGNFPKGGAMKFVRRMEKKLNELGGNINYKSRVKKVLVEKKRAIGIELENGDKHYGDWIISAADGHSTIFNMLEGKYTGKKISSLYNDNEIFQPLVQVSFGIDADLSEYPHAYTIDVQEKAGDAYINWFGVRHYCYDDSMAPKNKSTVTVLVPTELDLWKNIYADKQEYKKLKNDFAGAALRTVESVYPKVKGKVEVTDVATPMTTIRYTSNWKASYEGWKPNIKNLATRVPKTLPGLKNFRMAGQWTEPGGGIPTAVMSGRNAVYMICRKDKKKWKD